MWEAVTALATVGTGIAIVLTVLLGVRQLRLTGAHLEHLRRATQLEGVMKIFDDLNSHEFRRSFRFVTTELQDHMKDPAFREGVALVGMADDNVHRELHILRLFERVGTFVKNGLIDGAIIYDLALPPIVAAWEALGDVVRVHREMFGEGMWENFELLYRRGVEWRNREHDADYLKIVHGDAAIDVP